MNKSIFKITALCLFVALSCSESLAKKKTKVVTPVKNTAAARDLRNKISFVRPTDKSPFGDSSRKFTEDVDTLSNNLVTYNRVDTTRSSQTNSYFQAPQARQTTTENTSQRVELQIIDSSVADKSSNVEPTVVEQTASQPQSTTSSVPQPQRRINISFIPPRNRPASSTTPSRVEPTTTYYEDPQVVESAPSRVAEPTPTPTTIDEQAVPVDYTSRYSTLEEVDPLHNDPFNGDMVFEHIEMSNSFTYPISSGSLHSKYGWRRGQMHAGVDIKCNDGDNVYAIFDGVVRLAKESTTLGNYIIIRHNNGLESVSAHLSGMRVYTGQTVRSGDIIASVGNSDGSTPHLHFEIRYMGQYFDPEHLLDVANNRLKPENIYVTLSGGKIVASNIPLKGSRSSIGNSPIFYTVVRGDTLTAIATSNNTSVAAICEMNNISSKSVLRLGQQIRVR